MLIVQVPSWREGVRFHARPHQGKCWLLPLLLRLLLLLPPPLLHLRASYPVPQMIWKRMLESVDFIHSQRVIHSDLKVSVMLHARDA